MNAFKRKAVSFALSAAMLLGLAPSANIFGGTSAEAASVPDGFVYRKGTQFMLGDDSYYYGGTNCYYLTYKSNTEVDNVMDNAKDMGLSVIRLWGNLDVGKKTGEVKNGKPVFTGNNDGDGEKDGIYFQYWDDDKKQPVVNEGADGLRKLDYVIAAAEERGLKLLITFTNYWEAFGGMGQYIKYYQMLNGSTPGNSSLSQEDCCEFYTNETIKTWYKNYVNTLLNHENYYTGKKLKDSEGVFAWELANEPRCLKDGVESTDNTLYNWAKEMSEYVKSIDPYHMVSVGDEGFYKKGYQYCSQNNLPSAAYSGYYGADFEKLMTIDTIDFGTPHMYVDQWGFSGDDDLEWIKRHAQTTKDEGKPIIFEEFGLTDRTKRDAKYTSWLNIVTGDTYEGLEYQGFNYWMIASFMDDGTLYQDYDQYTVYGPADQATESSRQIIMAAAKKMTAKNGTVIDDSSSKADSSSKSSSSSKAESSSKADSSSKSSSSSKADSSSQASTNGVIVETTATSTTWTTTELATVDLTGYESAKIELKGASSFNNFILKYDGSDHYYYIGGSSVTATLDGSKLAYNDLPNISDLQNKKLTISVEGGANTYTLKVTGTKKGGSDTSSVSDSSSKNDDSSSKTDSSSKVDSSSKIDESSEEDVVVTETKLLDNTFTLDGKIGANFDYQIATDYVKGNYTIEAQAVNGSETITVPFNSSSTAQVDGVKAYRFTIPVASCNMTEQYSVKLLVKNSSGKTVYETDDVNFKINGYFGSFRFNSNKKLISLVSALQTYGYYSQNLFNTSAVKPVNNPGDVSDVKASDIIDYSKKTTSYSADKKITLGKSTLILGSETTIRFYISSLNSVDPDNLYLVYKDNGKKVTTKVEYSSDDKQYYADIPNIGATKLSKMYTVHFEENSKQVSDTVKYGAYSFVYTSLTTGSASTKNLAMALYKYSLAAIDYAGLVVDDPNADDDDDLDTEVTPSTRENFADYEGQISNVDINGTKLYSQDNLTNNFGSFGNLYDKSLYDDGNGSDVGIVFCGWNTYNYLQDPSLDYKLNYFGSSSEYGAQRMSFIPTYFIDTYEEGIKLNNSDTLDTDTQAEIMAKALNKNVRLNYRLHIDPQRFAPTNNTYSSVDVNRPGSQWWRGEFTQINPMAKDYLGMVDQGFEALEKTLAQVDTSKLVEPIRFDIGAELMTSIKNYTAEWVQLVEYCKAKRDASPLLKDNVIISYNFCHHIEYLIELEDHAEYFSRINGTGVTYKDRQDLLFVDDMTEENRKLLGEFIKSLDTFSISQYLPMDIFNSADLKDVNSITTTPEDVRDALLTHEQNFLQKVLIGKLGLEPDEIPAFHLGEYGMGIKGLTAPNVWDRTAWTDSELATYEVQQKHAEIALKGLALYLQDERSVAKSLQLWISGAPYDVINFYPGMNTGDAGHGYPGQPAYNANAAAVLKKYWHGEF